MDLLMPATEPEIFFVTEVTLSIAENLVEIENLGTGRSEHLAILLRHPHVPVMPESQARHGHAPDVSLGEVEARGHRPHGLRKALAD
jgi:hypothetical protein